MSDSNNVKPQFYTINHLVLSPLEHFSSNQDEIALTSSLSIVRTQSIADPVEKALLAAYDYNRSLQFDSSEFVGEFSHVLRWHVAKKFPAPLRDHYDFLLGPTHRFNELIQALRIIKSDPIQVAFSTSVSLLDGVPEFAVPGNLILKKFPELAKFKHPFVSFENYERQRPRVFPGENVVDVCDLESPEEIDYLKALMNILDKPSSPLRIAITRLGNYYLRYDVADEILDTVIALEILYAGGIKEEIKFRLALRVAAHLGGSDYAERQRLFKLAQDAYDLRSGIAHGGWYTIRDIESDKTFNKGSNKSVRAILAELVVMLKKALQSITLEVGDQLFKTEFHKTLDRCILTGTPFTVAELPQSDQKPK